MFSRELVQNKRGVTLLESVVYIAIVSAVLVAMAVWMIDLLRVRAKNQVVSEVQYNARLIQDRLSEAVRHAEGVNIGSSSFSVDPGVLSLDMVDLAADPTVFSLSQDDGLLQVSVAGGGETLITTDAIQVTNFVFTNLTSSEDLGIIQVEFTVKAVNDSGAPFYDYEESFQTAIRIPLDD